MDAGINITEAELNELKTKTRLVWYILNNYAIEHIVQSLKMVVL